MRRILDAERHATQRAAQTEGQSQGLRFLDAERDAALRDFETEG